MTRKVWFISLMAILISSSSAVAISNKQQIAVQELKETYKGVEVLTDGVKVKRIYGGAFGRGSSPAEVGDEFCRTFSSVLGTDSKSLVRKEFPSGSHLLEMMPDKATGEHRFTMAVYEQRVSGIPVFRSTLKLVMRNDADNSLVLASSGVRNLGDFMLDHSLAGVDPQSLAEAFNDPEFPGRANVIKPKIVIWAGTGNEAVQPRVAVTFVADDGPRSSEAYRYVIDVVNGALLFKESAIFNLDIYGNVAGNATEGVATDACADEVSTPLPYARVSSSTDTTYADLDGDYVLNNAGTGITSIRADLQGQYFQVDNYAGSEIRALMLATPPGPANLLLNSRNLLEYDRAQVNAYLHANIVRDFVLSYYPTWPELDDTLFAIKVNWNFGLIAQYQMNPARIRISPSTASYENGAFSIVVYHEYAHHVLYSAGNEAGGSYHEGMADALAVIISDSPAIGLGLTLGDCADTLRSAINDFQYPCVGGDPHDCIQLISGCIWDTRDTLEVGYQDYQDILGELTLGVMLASTSDDVEITPLITIDMLTLDDDDADIFNGTPHSDEINYGFGLHNMDIPIMTYDTIYVDSATGDDENAGTEAYPMETIQAGIDEASDGNVVLVLPGTYSETIDFAGKAIAIKSTRGPLYSRISGSSNDTLVTFDDTEANYSSLEGFSLLGGDVGIVCDTSAPVMRNNILDGQDSYGVLLNNSAYFWNRPTVINNTIVNGSGVGLWYKHSLGTVGGETVNTIDIRNNIITDNSIGVEAFYFEPEKRALTTNYYPAQYCDVYGNTTNYVNSAAGTGTISSDPLLYPDFSLYSSSPCIDAGDPDTLYNDSDDSRNDMGAIATTHLCGDVNDDAVVDTLDFSYLFEFMFNSGPPPFPYASADVDCISGVSISDLVWLLDYFYESGPAPCDCSEKSGIPLMGKVEGQPTTELPTSYAVRYNIGNP